MGELSILIIILTILFLSTLMRSTFGFGDAILAMPLLALFIPLETATPLVALVAMTTSIIILISHWKKIQFRIILPLILSSFAGIPFGIFFLKNMNEVFIKIFLGIMIIIFALYSLIKPAINFNPSKSLTYAFGFFGGILGGAYNTNGPPIIIYGALSKWPSVQFRVGLQGYFLFTGGMILFFHALTGNINYTVTTYYLKALPLILSAVFLGSSLHKKVSGKYFFTLIHLILLIIGSFLIYNSLFT